MDLDATFSVSSHLANSCIFKHHSHKQALKQIVALKRTTQEFFLNHKLRQVQQY